SLAAITRLECSCIQTRPILRLPRPDHLELATLANMLHRPAQLLNRLVRRLLRLPRRLLTTLLLWRLQLLLQPRYLLPQYTTRALLLSRHLHQSVP
ncbi:hypothetical protein IWW46_002569, partial [Coemansia sp. RSA 2440]